MANLNVLATDNNQAKQEKPPKRVCPRCNSGNTKFCYFNNYSISQPRYFCKNCRRYWTHGGALRNVPIGGSSRIVKRPRVDLPPVSRLVSVDIKQVNPPSFSYVQQNNEFVGSFGASSSSSAVAVQNHFGSLSGLHGRMVTIASPIRIFRQNHRLNYHNGSFEQDYYDVGSESSVMNQSFGGYVDNHNGYRINQVDQDKWNQSFNASTSGSRGSDMNVNGDMDNKHNRYKNSVIKHRCHLEKDGP